MTESEAFKKWCPMRRITEVGSAAVRISNTDQAQPFTLNCIGSACMMWRKDMVPNPDYRPHELVFHTPTIPAYVPHETDGHCGLAVGP